MQDQIGFTQEKPNHHYRAEIPNCVDDAGLDPYEYRVYGHVKRIASDHGTCFQSVKNIALHCKISERKAIEILSNLCSINKFLGIPLIKKTMRKKENGCYDTCIYEIIDVWHLNKHLYCKEKITGAQYAPPLVQDMHHPGAQYAYKEELVKKNPIKKLECAREKSIADELSEKYRALKKSESESKNKSKSESRMPKAKRPVPEFLKIRELSDRDRQVLANQYPDNVLVLALDDAKKWSKDGEFIKNPAAYLTSRCKKYKSKGSG
jgi:hypothetical protein